jgi:hypothetical protein
MNNEEKAISLLEKILSKVEKIERGLDRIDERLDSLDKLTEHIGQLIKNIEASQGGNGGGANADFPIRYSLSVEINPDIAHLKGFYEKHKPPARWLETKD